MRVLKVARAHVGITAAGALLLLGGGVATAAVVVTPASSTDEVSEAPEAPAATTTVAPEPTPVVEPPVVVEPVSPAEAPPAANVDDVPRTAPQAPQLPPGHRLPDLAPGQDPAGVGSINPDGVYCPMQMGVEGTPVYVCGSNATAEPLPGEPDYQGPVPDVAIPSSGG